MLDSVTLARIDGYVNFIKGFVLTTYQSDIADVPYKTVPALGQPGLYIDGKMATTVFLKPELLRNNITYESGKLVLIKEISKEQKDNQYWGIIFHEYGHAAMDKLRKNGSATAEPNAWAVELMSLAEYIRTETSLAAAAKEYVKARRAAKMFAKFEREYETQAKAAYRAITGEDFQ